MVFILSAVVLLAIAFLIWGWNDVVLRDSKGRLLSRKVKSADEGALAGLSYGTYIFEIWHVGLFHLRPRLVKTIRIEHNKISENAWMFSYKLMTETRLLRLKLRNPEAQLLKARYLTDGAIFQAVEKSYFKVLNNLYLPKNSISDTTTIDSVLIHPTGIYLFENSVSEGWIYGDADGKFWSATVLRNNRTKNSEFENPVLRSMRNEEALRRMFEKAESLPLHIFSYVVFGDKAVLKDVPGSSVERKLVLRGQLSQSLTRTFSLATPVYTEKEIDELALELVGFADKVTL